MSAPRQFQAQVLRPLESPIPIDHRKNQNVVRFQFVERSIPIGAEPFESLQRGKRMSCPARELDDASKTEREYGRRPGLARKPAVMDMARDGHRIGRKRIVVLVENQRSEKRDQKRRDFQRPMSAPAVPSSGAERDPPRPQQSLGREKQA